MGAKKRANSSVVEQNVAEEVRKHPDLPASEVAKRAACSVNYVYHVRSTDKKLAAKAARQAAKKVPSPITGKPVLAGRKKGKKARRGRQVDGLPGPASAAATPTPTPEAQVTPSLERAFLSVLFEVGLSRAKALVLEAEQQAKVWSGMDPS